MWPFVEFYVTTNLYISILIQGKPTYSTLNFMFIRYITCQIYESINSYIYLLYFNLKHIEIGLVIS